MLTFPSFLLRFFFIHILIFYSILGSFSSLFMPFFTCLNSYVVFILFEVINHSYSWILKLLCKFLFIFEVFKFSSWGDIFKAHASWFFHVSCVSALLFVLFFFLHIPSGFTWHLSIQQLDLKGSISIPLKWKKGDCYNSHNVQVYNMYLK